MRLDVKRNTLIGAISGISNKIFVTVLPFIMRTIMINVMGIKYLGLSSLFSSILNMLSLAELGFGGALVYSMYKPIADNDTNVICALMGLYKNIYRIIGAVILAAGLIIMPFINHLINGDVPSDINIYTLYLIYLINTVSSYFLFAYKNSLLAAFQRNDISNVVSTILTTIEYGIQIALVITLRNYYCYAVIFPVFTVAGNIIRAVIVQRKYPQYICKGTVSKELRTEIYKKTLALASHKLGNTISTSLDSMVISAFLGLSSVAIFGNYNYVVATVMAVIWIVYYSMTAGIGNRMNLYSEEKNYADFKALTSFNNAVVCWATGCMLFLYQPFIEIWTGKENMLGTASVIIFCIYFYVFQSRKVVLLYKDAAGLWREDQLKPIVGAILNLAVSITLVKIIGINGVIISSIVSFLVVEIPWESRALYKYYFKKSAWEYLKVQLKSFALCIPCWAFISVICYFINLSAAMNLIVKGIICAIVPIPYIWIVYRKDKGFIRMVNKIIPKKLINY